MSVTLGVGATQQLSYQLLGPLYGIGTPQWSSSNPSVASVNAVGIVTALAVGTAIVTATLGSVSGTTTVTVAALDEVGFLRAGILGGDSAITAIYSARTSVMTLDGSNNILIMQDARGAGFLGNLTPQSSAGPLLNGSDPATRTIDLSPGHTLISAASAKLALTQSQTLAIVSTMNGTGQGSTAVIGQPDRSVWFGDANYDRPGYIHGAAQDATGAQPFGGTLSQNSRNYSSRLRLHVYDIYSLGGTTVVRQTCPEYDEELATVRNFGSSTQCLLLGFDASIPTTQSVRAVVVLPRQRTPADLTALHTWAHTFH